MTKLRVCDISEGVSRVEHLSSHTRILVCVCVWHIRHSDVCVCVCAPQEGRSYPNGPRTDLVWPGREEVLQLQDCVAGLDDLAQGAGGGKREESGLNGERGL